MKIMKYSHRFRVHASLAKVAEFHSRSASMPTITPPPIIVRVQRAPAVLAEGDEMDFTMWLGPLPLRWLARIEAVSPNGFSDRQLLGPFAEWVHRHSFIMVNEQATDVFDEIILNLRNHPFLWSIGLGMRLGMPFLFAYRGWKTKRMLE
jgi:ligand-binding SRPBCC domain-containing protein